MLLTFITFSLTHAQVGVNADEPDPSAILDIKDNTKGILIPRLTSAEKIVIKNPAFSLLVYNTTLSCYYKYYVPNSISLEMAQFHRTYGNLNYNENFHYVPGSFTLNGANLAASSATEMIENDRKW